ncbi:tRNA pseudouridine(38-40) synthase TruA [Janibacter cremeus]|uniref:tRNA pseudouridine(38-40) synthase TruA n=1 Tax=Janibacter cremeus TaxID=1285192 RepID=UPI0023F8B1FF|nr:tRNA pseudouridine(38-40) synthase TruA [Janibacter cremeus]WEV78002.1 tRNA pseudouridine(38-40) synthase TruA [Janibacter cremeus]
MRLRLDLAYDGTDFHGWAAQPGLRTVEGELTAGLTRIMRPPDPVRVTVAGRTDAGVHALGQVVHLDVDPSDLERVRGHSDRPLLATLVTRLRGVLPGDVVVRSAFEAPEGFDARFSATSRRYRYLLCDDPTRLDPLRRREVVPLRTPLDVDAMNAAATRLLGLRNFAAFCKKREGASTTRTLLRYDWQRREDGLLEATVLADAFCHSMVRALIGALVPVGTGEQGPQWPEQVLTAGVRDPRVKVMPAHGLTLVEVAYPPAEQLAERAHEARARREE